VDYCAMCLNASEQDLNRVMGEFAEVYGVPMQIRAWLLHGIGLATDRELEND